MAEFSKYNLYSINTGSDLVKKSDEVDLFLDGLKTLTEYGDVLDFVQEHFGEFEGTKLLNFPEINKQIHLLVETRRIEICAAKNKHQYYGQGWMIKTEDV